MDMIRTDEAPAAIGPYAQAVRLGNFIFCSGQLPLNPKTMAMAGDTAGAQTRQVLDNLGAVLRAAGADWHHVVKSTVFLKNMNDFPDMNAVYTERFGGHTPARSTIEVARLPKDALVEIECIACLAP